MKKLKIVTSLLLDAVLLAGVVFGDTANAEAVSSVEMLSGTQSEDSAEGDAINSSAEADEDEISANGDTEENVLLEGENSTETGTEEASGNNSEVEADTASSKETAPEASSQVNETETTSGDDETSEGTETDIEGNKEVQESETASEDSDEAQETGSSAEDNKEIQEIEAATEEGEGIQETGTVTVTEGEARGTENVGETENGGETGNETQTNDIVKSGEETPDASETPAEDSEITASEGEVLSNNIEGTDIPRPAFSYEEVVDGWTISLFAKEGVIPEGTSVEINKLTDAENENTETMIQNTIDNCVLDATGFEIKLTDFAGNEFEPESGNVHITIKISDEAAMEMYELGGSAKMEVFHFHDEDINEMNTKMEKSESDVAVPKDITKECYVDESDIDANTRELTYSAVPKAVMLGRKTERYMQDITLDFDTDSFSRFVPVILNTYTFDPEVSGNLTTYTLNNSEYLANDFRNYLQNAFNEAWKSYEIDGNYYKVVIPAGTYDLTSSGNEAKEGVRIGSNTTLEMTGVTIRRGDIEDEMLQCKRPQRHLGNMMIIPT